MKRIFSLIILCLALMLGYSCKKCISCKTYAVLDHSLIDEDQSCDLPQFADDWEIDYKLDWDDNYTYVECAEE